MRTIAKRVATLRRKAKDRQGVQKGPGETRGLDPQADPLSPANPPFRPGGPGGPGFFDETAMRANEREYDHDHEHAGAQKASCGSNHLDPLDPLDPLSNSNGLREPPTWTPRWTPWTPDYRWTDDRAWICEVQNAPDQKAKLAILTAWVESAGGQVTDGTAHLAPLQPPHQRRLAELELRRMLRQHGLDVADPCWPPDAEPEPRPCRGYLRPRRPRPASRPQRLDVRRHEVHEP
jgi:hypothetical protein